MKNKISKMEHQLAYVCGAFQKCFPVLTTKQWQLGEENELDVKMTNFS